MLDGWKEVRLDETCSKITDGAHYSPKGITDGYPMLTVKDMREQGFDYTSCKKISQSDFDDMVRNDCVPKENDVLVAKDGSYLKHVFVVKESKQEAILSSIAIFRPEIDILYPNYLKYFILNPVTKRMIKENYVSGSAIPRIVLKDFKKIRIKLPKVEEQKAIAHILSTLDEKIEVNNKINKTLENMAQEIFNHWFVDFEFPDNDGEPYKSLGGEMVESEFGLIPKGWEVKNLEEISSNIITGKTPSTKDKSNFNGDIQFVKIPDMHGQVYITKTEAYLSESGVNDNKIIPANSVMVSCIATPGLVSLAAEKCQTNQQINTIVNTNPKMSYYTYFLLNNLADYIKTLGSSGSTTLNLNKGQFSKIKVIKPKDEYIYAFYDLVEPIFKGILNNQRMVEKLESIRDTLLPKLMSGEIRVPLDNEEQ